MNKKIAVALLTLVFNLAAVANEYTVDKKGMHASINFKVQHLGYSWLTGRFNDFDGSFSWDPSKPEQSKISLTINTASIDSNHSSRDKHLRSPDFLEIEKYAKATFTSTSFQPNKASGYTLIGDLTLHGITKSISIDVSLVGEGKDPWGGYRAGFSGTTKIVMADYGIKKFEGSPAGTVYFDLHIEGVKK
jgi:polyisoprenoid-binding protein YceI